MRMWCLTEKALVDSGARGDRQALAWFLNDLFNVQRAYWVGFLIVFGGLILLAGLAGLVGLRWIKKGSPPAPTMAIEEAKVTKAELTEARR